MKNGGGLKKSLFDRPSHFFSFFRKNFAQSLSARRKNNAPSFLSSLI